MDTWTERCQASVRRSRTCRLKLSIYISNSLYIHPFRYNDDVSQPKDSGGECGGTYDSVLSKIEVDVTRPVHSMMEVKWFTRWGGSSSQDIPASSVLTSDTARLFVIGTTKLDSVQESLQNATTQYVEEVEESG